MAPDQTDGEVLALEIRGLTKRFPGVLALDDVAFALRRGEIHAIVGQNGAGKSTMINILSGMVAPDAGEIRLGGQAVTIDTTRRAIELGVATVYQEPSLLPNLTIAQNIVLGREPQRLGIVLDVGAMRAAARRALARVGIAIAEDTQVGALSLAERQLIEIAKALAQGPNVLVLDEPTAALGKRDVERLFVILHGLRSEGISIVYVSHRFREILDLCDRATVLRNGAVVTATKLAGWTEADLTEAMVGGRSELFARSRAVAPGPALIEAHGLCYRDQVKDITFSVAAGEIVALTGLLGSGQNEIARLLAGDRRPDAGSIAIRGQTVTLRHPSDGNLAGVCLLSDERAREGILANLALRENVALPSLNRRRAAVLFVDATTERWAVRQLMQQFGVVASSLETPIRTLSGGNQQKALIARWHLATAGIFILIEPTHGVDVAARTQIYRTLDALAASGRALIVVSSEITEILAIADRILIIREGRISATTTPLETDEESVNLMIQGAR
jgi:ABC-type sugar transport system ATPase subunit